MLGKIASALFSLVESGTDALDTGLGLIVSFEDPDKKVTPDFALDLAIVTGVAVGLVSFLTLYSFQGPFIRKFFGKEEEIAQEIDEEQIQPLLGPAPASRLIPYTLMKYAYLTATILSDPLANILMLSATKAWIQGFYSENLPLAGLSHAEVGSVIAYYLLFDAPFSLTNEVPATWKEIRKLFSIEKHQIHVYDQAFTNKMKSLASLLVQYPFIRKSIRLTGSIADTLEHIIPVILFIPPTAILDVLEMPLYASVPIGIFSALFTLLISNIILIQTFLFEGAFTKKNLEKIANVPHNDEEEERWVPDLASKIAHYLLYFGAPIHGIDTALTVWLALKEKAVIPAITYSAAAATFIISSGGNWISEVRESQDELKNITIGVEREPEPPKPIKPTQTAFFKVRQRATSIDDTGDNNYLDLTMPDDETHQDLNAFLSTL